MDDIIDLLKIKIEKAKRELSLETVNAIDAVDWRGAIIGMRARKGYTFEQLGDLELETELLLCGLIIGEDYPQELERRMKISKTTVRELINEMNDLVFKKIKEELIKNIERKKTFAGREENNENDIKVLNSAGIKIIPEKLELMTTSALTLPVQARDKGNQIESREDLLKKIEKPEPARPLMEAGGVTQPILTQKLSSSSQTPMVKTDHSLENISSVNKEPIITTIKTAPKIDPYREIPE